MKPFEEYFRTGQYFRSNPNEPSRRNPQFTPEESRILQLALQQVSKVRGRTYSQAEVDGFLQGFISGIMYLGQSGAKLIFTDKN
jgi:hypothetical protein